MSCNFVVLKQSMKKYNDVRVPSLLTCSKELTHSSFPLYSALIFIIFFKEEKGGWGEEKRKIKTREGLKHRPPSSTSRSLVPAGAAWWENHLFLMSVVPRRRHLLEELAF